VAIGSAEGEALATLGIIALAGSAWRSRLGGQIDARLVIDGAPSDDCGRWVRLVTGRWQLDRLSGVWAATARPRHPAATIARVACRSSRTGAISGRRLPRVGLQRVPLAAAEGAEARARAMLVRRRSSGVRPRPAGQFSRRHHRAAGRLGGDRPAQPLPAAGSDAVGKQMAVDPSGAGKQRPSTSPSGRVHRPDL